MATLSLCLGLVSVLLLTWVYSLQGRIKLLRATNEKLKDSIATRGFTIDCLKRTVKHRDRTITAAAERLSLQHDALANARLRVEKLSRKRR